MRLRLTALFSVILLSLSALQSAAQTGFETNARAAWVYDLTTGTVLLEKNANEALPPASMSKIMTLYMVFEALRDGRLTLETQLPVSTRARQIGGSTMFLNEMDRPTVEELIKGIVVLSGNDACIVVAEGLAGTEDAFARQMTDRGRQIGLTNSHFANSTGWPHPEHRMSMHDLGIVAERIIRDFPEYYPYFALTRFDFDGRAPANTQNRNPILGLDIGADGLKTGHTNEAGYGLVGSAVQGERRVIFVINGLPSERARAEESERIVNWAFRDFTMQEVVPGGETVTHAPVWMGTRARVPLTTENGLRVLLPRGASGEVSAQAVYQSPIDAPIAAGDRLGQLEISLPGGAVAQVPLLAALDVPEAGFVGRLQNAALRLVGRGREAVGL